MKKFWISLVLLGIFLVGLITVQAVTPKIIDDAGLLTQDQLTQLESQAQTLASEWGMDVVIVTTWSLEGKTSQQWADDYYDTHGYGIGENASGMLLLLAMESRDWAVSTCGNAIQALPDGRIDALMDLVLPYLSDGDYFLGFQTFLQTLSAYCHGDWQYATGDRPVPDSPHRVTLLPGRIHLGWLLISSLAMAGIAIWAMVTGMKTGNHRNSAGYYLDPGSFDLYQSRDRFLYSQTSRVRRAESDSSGHQHHGSGSSTHHSSSGRSHGGRSGKF